MNSRLGADTLRDAQDTAGISASDGSGDTNSVRADGANRLPPASAVPAASATRAAPADGDASSSSSEDDEDEDGWMHARATLFNRAVCFYKMRRHREALMDLACCLTLAPNEALTDKIFQQTVRIGKRLVGIRHVDPEAETAGEARMSGCLGCILVHQNFIFFFATKFLETLK